MTFSEGGGGSGEARLTGRVAVNQRQCAQVGTALLIAPEGWALETEGARSSTPATVVRLGREMSFTGIYRELDDEQSVDIADCIDDGTTAVFYATRLSE